LQQLRICSGHFRGGRKSEGDIPVADPDVDDPIRIDVTALTAVKHAEKSPKCRRTTSVGSAAAAVAGSKLASSAKSSGLGVRPVVEKLAITSACSSYTGVELHGRYQLPSVL